MQWIVERTHEDFETVIADTLSIDPEGLIFRTGHRLTLAIATGQWITVFEEYES